MATLKDIADAVNLSVATVSLILNDKGKRINPQTIKLVKEMAKKIDYHPNVMAQSLVKRRTRTIGLIVPNIQNIFFAELAKYISDFFKERGYTLLLCNTDYDIKEDIRQLKSLKANLVAGIIGVLTNSEDTNYLAEIDKIYADKIPFVILDRQIKGHNCPYIGTDNLNGASLAVQYLIGNHHKRIALVKGPYDSFSADQRFAGYKKALSEAGIEYDEKIVFPGDYQAESGYRAGKKIVQDSSISAVFVCNDMMAYGVYQAVNENGKRIGKDLSVVGFDDLPFSALLEVPLTSVHQNVKGIADCAAERLMAQIEGKVVEEEISLFLPTLTIRKSVSELDE